MDAQSVTFRRAGVADADVLAPLAREIFYATFAHLSDPVQMARYMEQAFSVGQLRSELADPQCDFLLACADGAPIGYAKLRSGGYRPECVTGSAPIELSRLYIRADYHGRGVAYAMMERCLELARQRGGKTWWLGVWEHNKRARAFYRKWGFVEVGAHPFQFADELQEDLVMARAIEPESMSTAGRVPNGGAP